MTPAPTPSAKVALGLPTIARRLKGMAFPEVDLVVGVATGGIVPASLIAYELELPLSLLTINYRAEDNRPQRTSPELVKPFDAIASATIASAKRILLVDDVSVSGATLALAKGLLTGRAVTTCVLKGRADLVAFPEVKACVAWPWRG
jgi:uncharacterized protein